MLWSMKHTPATEIMKKYGMISAFQEYNTWWERQDKTIEKSYK